MLQTVEEAEVVDFRNAAEVAARRQEQVGTYNQRSLVRDHFSLASVVAACRGAERLDQMMSDGAIPGGNTSRVSRLWKAIAGKVHPLPMPAGFRVLRSER